eukprot:3202281-Pyramimonas_sp.AAC.1
MADRRRHGKQGHQEQSGKLVQRYRGGAAALAGNANMVLCICGEVGRPLRTRTRRRSRTIAG